MGIGAITLKCPECGASLSAEEGMEQVFCSYCGAKVILKNENEYVYRQVDEAGLLRAENDRVIRLRELEIEEREQAHRNKVRSILFYVWLASIVIVGMVLLVMGITGGWTDAFLGLFYIGGPVVGGGAYILFKLLPDKEVEKDVRAKGGVRFPRGLGDFTEQHYETVQSALLSAGFSNVRCVSMHDVTLGIFQKPGMIEKITVDGKQIRMGGRFYEPDVPIVITYHGR